METNTKIIDVFSKSFLQVQKVSLNPQLYFQLRNILLGFWLEKLKVVQMMWVTSQSLNWNIDEHLLCSVF